MTAESAFERRLSAVEDAVLTVRTQLEAQTSNGDWIERVSGSVTDEAAFMEALRFGREFRQTDRPPPETADPS